MSFNVSSRSGTLEEQSIEEHVDTVTVKKVGVALSDRYDRGYLTSTVCKALTKI